MIGAPLASHALQPLSLFQMVPFTSSSSCSRLTSRVFITSFTLASISPSFVCNNRHFLHFCDVNESPLRSQSEEALGRVTFTFGEGAGDAACH